MECFSILCILSAKFRLASIFVYSDVYNFVNVYTVRYRVHVYTCRRAHFH